ncbi:MAG: hypothetical protein KJ067_23410 [Vicinamibacteria bacterium]|nr:hypothetical protein [Vicinamibacteria bacterium]
MNATRLNELIGAVKLEGVRLVETHAVAHVRRAGGAGDVTISIDRAAAVPDPPEAGRFYVRASVAARVEAKAAVLVSIAATFELEYECPEVVTPTTEDLAAFAQTNGVFNAWPYWREYLQATLQRMQLPPIVLPLMTMKQIVSSLGEQQPALAAPKPKRRATS